MKKGYYKLNISNGIIKFYRDIFNIYKVLYCSCIIKYNLWIINEWKLYNTFFIIILKWNNWYMKWYMKFKYSNKKNKKNKNE